jgi:hypothetical protein
MKWSLSEKDAFPQDIEECRCYSGMRPGFRHEKFEHHYFKPLKESNKQQSGIEQASLDAVRPLGAVYIGSRQ